jgi:hypothetical protein
MAAVNPPPWLQAGSYPARNDRLGAITAMLYYSGFSFDESAPLRPRQGVRPSYQNFQLKVRAATTPNMTVIVSPGICWIDNHDINGYGTYTLINDGDVTLTVAPAGGAGQYRKDSVCFSVYDAETAGSANESRLEIIQGPYAASAGAAVRGTIPPNAIVLADLAIAPSQTSVSTANISDPRNFTVGLGGIAPIPSVVAPDHPHPGQMWYEADLDRFRYGTSTGAIKPLMPDWQSYTPVWGSSGTAPNIGNGTLSGRYLLQGKTCTALFEMMLGTTSSLGTGTWNWTLPFTAASPAGTTANFSFVGSARGHGGQWYHGATAVLKGTNLARIYSHTAVTEWSPTEPVAWTKANTSYLHGEITFEIQ